MSSGPAMDQRFRVSCLLCKTPLGLPENHQYMICYLTSLSKIHLESLRKKIMKPQPLSTSKGTPVLVTDISSVYQQLFNGAIEGGLEKGIWCEKDGCVFNTIFCPFCSTNDNCLGVQVMATDASNIHLLNKVGLLCMLIVCLCIYVCVLILCLFLQLSSLSVPADIVLCRPSRN